MLYCCLQLTPCKISLTSIHLDVHRAAAIGAFFGMNLQRFVLYVELTTMLCLAVYRDVVNAINYTTLLQWI